MLICLLPVLVVAIILSVYAVNTLLVAGIEIVGESRYDDAAIAKTSTVSEGQRLLLISRKAVKNELLENLPYIENVKISLIPPGLVRITVTPAIERCQAILPEGKYVISESWRILGEVQADHDLLPLLKAELPERQQIGDTLAFFSESEQRLCVDIFNVLKDNDILKDISEIDMINTAEISLEYLSRFRVELGDKLDLAAKLQLVEASAGSLLETARGVLDATLDGRVSYRPGRKGQ